jgi:Icc-related predicted phosphoesterase
MIADGVSPEFPAGKIKSMKLLIFSDIHSDARGLARLMAIDADYYFCAGDLVNWGRGLDAMGEILTKRAGQVYVLPGNHESAQQISDFCGRFGLNDFHGGRIEIDGFQVIGLGYSNPTPFDTPGEYSEEELEQRLHAFDGLKPMIAICHAPPYGTMLDRITNLRHAGSTAMRDFLRREQPRYFFCGHIHEAAGAQDKLGETSAMNVGRKGYLLDLEKAAPQS